MSAQPVEDAIISHVIAAGAAGSWDELKLLLHPYLHWSADGVTLRGRSNVLRWLASRREPPLPPTGLELRDGQVYRWIGSRPAP